MVLDSLFTQKHAVIEVMSWLLVSERKVSRCAIILLVCIMRRGRRGTKDAGEGEQERQTRRLLPGRGS